MENIIEPFEDSKKKVAPGFFETRRRTLWLPASIAASVLLERAGTVFAAESRHEKTMSRPESKADSHSNISTYYGPDVGFSFLDIAATPKENEHRLFEAAWKGQTV